MWIGYYYYNDICHGGTELNVDLNIGELNQDNAKEVNLILIVETTNNPEWSIGRR